MTKSGDAREDFIGRLGPHEWPRAFVRDLNVPPDGRLQLARAAVHAAAQLQSTALTMRAAGGPAEPPDHREEQGDRLTEECHPVPMTSRRPRDSSVGSGLAVGSGAVTPRDLRDSKVVG